MKKLQMVMETEKRKAIKCKSLKVYEDKIKDRDIAYKDNKGNIVYTTNINTIKIKSFLYNNHQAALVLTVKDMLTGTELSEAIYF